MSNRLNINCDNLFHNNALSLCNHQASNFHLREKESEYQFQRFETTVGKQSYRNMDRSNWRGIILSLFMWYNL